MKTIRIATLLSLVPTLLTACAFGAKSEAMVVPGAPMEGGRISEVLAEQVEVSPVTGGSDTYMMWKSEIGDEAFRDALVGSLAARELYSENGRFELTARIEEVDQPWAGFSFDVTTRIRYELKDRETGEVLLDEVVVGVGTATTDDSFWGVKRLRLANERSARKNIAGLVDALSRLDVSSVAVSRAE